MPQYAVRHAMDMGNTVVGILSTTPDGRVAAFDPSPGQDVPFIVAEAYARREPVGYVRAMMRLHTLQPLPTDPTVEACLAALPTPDTTSPPGPIPTMGDLERTRPTAPEASDPDQAIGAVCTATGEPADFVRTVVDAARAAVDDLVTDDVLLIAHPLVIARVGCPVWERVRYLVKHDWDGSLDVFDGSAADLAAALHLPTAITSAYPTAGTGTVMADVLDTLAADTSTPDGSRIIRVVDAWLRTHQTPAGSLRPYRVRPAGLERVFEDWLVEHLDVLTEHGYPLRLADPDLDGFTGRQVPVHERHSLADLLGVATHTAGHVRAGDLVVVENKTTPVGPGAIDQLARYVDLAGTATDRPIHGLLIADGLTVDAGRALAERGFGYLSLTAIGYRGNLRSQTQPLPFDPDATSAGYPQAAPLR